MNIPDQGIPNIEPEYEKQTRFYCLCDLDLNVMTSIYEFDPIIPKMNLYNKNVKAFES